ncbi:MAG: molybdopterin-dependent oxidoreductase [Thermoleophilaceae bacterium]
MTVLRDRLIPGRGQAPPGPFRPTFWRSPLRGPWLTSLLGATLGPLIVVVAVTGLLSNAAYDPRLGQNALGRTLGPLDVYLFSWPTSPAWLYSVTQGLHVAIGLAAFPILLAKLWSVIPRLFEWPAARSVAHALERLSLALLVGGALFEFATGILDTQVYYPFKFFFTDAHYYGAWVFLAAFVFHVAIKLPLVRSQLRTRRALLAPLEADLAHTRAESAGPDSNLVPVAPAPASISRRGLLGAVGTGSLFLLVMGLGPVVGGPLRRLALLSPRGRDEPSGPNGFQVNRSAAAARIDRARVGGGWRLELHGAREERLSRRELEAMPQYTYELPIACVEGWTSVQTWSGVRLRDLAARAGIPGGAELTSISLETNGVFGRATLSSGQVADRRALLALRVNGADLSIDHGYPARVIVPALPGVHCTKWVARMEFRRS